MTAVYEWIRNLTAFFLFLSVMENLLPGQKYGKYIRLFAGMVLILLAVEPFTSGFTRGGGRTERAAWGNRAKTPWADFVAV